MKADADVQSLGSRSCRRPQEHQESATAQVLSFCRSNSLA